MLEIKTNGDNETYCITFDSDEIRAVLRYFNAEEGDELTLDEIRDIAVALSDMFDGYFAEWIRNKED